MMKKGQQIKDSLRAYQPSRSSLNSSASAGNSGLDVARGKKGGLFKRWSRKAVTDNLKDALSTEGHDGSNEGSADSGSSNCSVDTQQTSNNSGRFLRAQCTNAKDPLNSPVVEQKLMKSGSGHSSQSSSPTGVDHFPEGDSGEESEDTPKTQHRTRRSVSTYFDASCAVIPLPFGFEDKVPEVTRQTSKQYNPSYDRIMDQTAAEAPTPKTTTEPQVVRPSSSTPELAVAPPEEENDPISAETARKRNSLQAVLKGQAQVTVLDRKHRDPTGSIQEEEELYARSRSLLRDQPIIPREAYIDHEYDQRSLSPPTIDTRLQSTVDSRTIRTMDSRESRMHFSVNSRMSTTMKRIPDDPNATIFIPIQQGIKVPLRRCPEVQSALATEFYDTPNCPCCQRQLAVIADAAFLYCPLCREISPLFGNIRAVGEYPEEPEYLRFGLGLGMTWEAMKKVYAELYGPNDHTDRYNNNHNHNNNMR